MTNVSKLVVDSGDTRHICADKNVFTSYTAMRDGEEVYLGGSKTTPVLGKGKVFLKLAYGKMLALSDVIHVPTIKVNLVFVALLGKVRVKVSFESNKIVMIENNVFGKGYCDQGIFVLNVSKVINGNAITSAYMIDSYDMWYARLGHTNSAYVFKLQQLGLINMHDNQTKKFIVCIESKLTKTLCASVQCEIELLNLIHSNLVDIKQTMSRGDKSYFITFIDDFSRYTKFYLIRYKDEVFNMFLSYKVEVENQLNRKQKGLYWIGVVSTLCLMTSMKRKVSMR